MDPVPVVAIEVVSVCVFHEQTLLTLRRSADRKVYPGAWEVVSGRVRKGEDLSVAASREIAEESGLNTLACGAPIDVYQAPYGERCMLVHVFTARVATPNVVLSSEHDAFRWVTLEEFTTLCSFERLVQSAQRAFSLVTESQRGPGSH